MKHAEGDEKCIDQVKSEDSKETGSLEAVAVGGG
jgi:hypothetical protein